MNAPVDTDQIETPVAHDTEPACPRNVDELEDLLSTPTPEVVESLGQLEGDLVILGAGGKIGPSLARMAARGLAMAGSDSRVIGVSRWSDPSVRSKLESAGVSTISADLGDPASYPELPSAGAVLFLAGQKFGTASDSSGTWWTNAVVPSLAASRYRGIPTLAYSTGNVYEFRALTKGGSRETDDFDPLGAYAQSCVAREEVFRHSSLRWGTPVLLYRLNYAIELRYGVLVDIAMKIHAGEPIDVTTPAVNVIWQGDSNAWTLRAMSLCTTPASALNATGPETAGVRRIATIIGEHLGRSPEFVGDESSDTFLSDAGPCHARFGYPSVALYTAIRWTAEWVSRGGATSGKATKFEQRKGRY